MNPLSALFILFLVVPLFEIWFLIKIGGLVGAGWTIFLVVLTAFIGAILVRAQGLSTVARIHREMNRGELPALAMLETLILFVAGALLLTPGFFTDLLGFAALIPPLRRWFLTRGLPMWGVHYQASSGPGTNSAQRPLEGDWKRDD